MTIPISPVATVAALLLDAADTTSPAKRVAAMEDASEDPIKEMIKAAMLEQFKEMMFSGEEELSGIPSLETSI